MAAANINQSPIPGAAKPLSDTSRATPTTATTVATKNDRGSQFLDAIDSRIGVKIIAKLMINPAFVAEVCETPDVSQ